jgi:hypothetical protein
MYNDLINAIKMRFNINDVKITCNKFTINDGDSFEGTVGDEEKIEITSDYKK